MIEGTASVEAVNSVVGKILADFEGEVSPAVNKLVTPNTGLMQLDAITGGIPRGQVTILGARPGMGKTAFLVNLVSHVVVEQGLVCLYFSFEQSKEDLALRMLSKISRIPSTRLRQAQLRGTDWSQLTHAVDVLSKGKLYLSDSSSLSPEELLSECQLVLKQLGKIDLIVVDCLQLCRGTAGASSSERDFELAEFLRGIKTFAIAANCSVLISSQVDRRVETRLDKRPRLGDLREITSIEGRADVVILLYRDEVYYRDSESKGTAELHIVKNRSGELAWVRLGWIPETQIFCSL